MRAEPFHRFGAACRRARAEFRQLRATDEKWLSIAIDESIALYMDRPLGNCREFLRR